MSFDYAKIGIFLPLSARKKNVFGTWTQYVDAAITALSSLPPSSISTGTYSFRTLHQFCSHADKVVTLRS